MKRVFDALWRVWTGSLLPNDGAAADPAPGLLGTWWRRLGAVTLPLAAAFAYWYAIGLRWGSGDYAGADWGYFRHEWEAGYVTIMRFRELPLWDPWLCGGWSQFGDMQSAVYSPLFLLALMFGTLFAVKLQIVLFTAVGLGGAYFLARQHMGVGPGGAALAAVMFATNSFFSMHIFVAGQASFIPCYLLPLLILVWRRSVRSLPWAAAVAALLALTIVQGGIYPLTYFALVLAIDGFLHLTDGRRLRAVVAAGATSAVLFALLASFRLLPVFRTSQWYPRITGDDEYEPLKALFGALTQGSAEFNPDIPLGLTKGEWTGFISMAGLVLALVGLALAARRHRWLVLMALLFLTLTMGKFSDYSPWVLLHQLPIYKSVRMPCRFVFVLGLYLSLAAALALDGIRKLIADYTRSDGLASVLGFMVVGWVAYQTTFVGSYPLEVSPDPMRTRPEPEAAYWIKGGEEMGTGDLTVDDDILGPARGVGISYCYTGIPYNAAPGLWTGKQPQVRVASGSVGRDWRTANTITAEVALDAVGDVTFNQTWAHDWFSDVGRVEADAQGRIVVRDVPAGARVLHLQYRPRDLIPGVALSVVGLLATFGVGVVWPWWSARRA